MSASYEDIEDQLPPDTLPALMSFPRTAKDVSEIVKFANDNGMKVSIKNSGHSWSAGSSSPGSLQINLRKFPKVSSRVVVVELNCAYDMVLYFH